MITKVNRWEFERDMPLPWMVPHGYWRRFRLDDTAGNSIEVELKPNESAAIVRMRGRIDPEVTAGWLREIMAEVKQEIR